MQRAARRALRRMTIRRAATDSDAAAGFNVDPNLFRRFDQVRESAGSCTGLSGELHRHPLC